MRKRRVLGFVLVGALIIGGAALAEAGVTCGKPSKCTNAAVVADVRAAVAAACPCSAATKSSAYAKCFGAVVKAQVKALGKAGFPTACRTDVKRALASSTCGRADSVLCRKVSRKGVESCRLAKAAKCVDPYERVESSCVDACACSVEKANKRSVGCDYFATSMDVFRHGDCFAAFIVNASSAAAAHIAVRYDGVDLPVESFTRVEPTLSAYDANAGLPPGAAAVVFLGGGTGATPLCPVASAMPISSFVDTGIFKAFEITTDVPVVAYEINPFGGGAASTTGASLLLPTSVWDTDYVAVNAFGQSSTPSGGVPNRSAFGPSLNIVAREDDTVATIVPVVTVTGGGGIPPGNAGVPFAITLMKGQHAQITQNTELTGSRISANKPIGLMAGHPCMTVPTNQQSFCDHGEQMIPPLRALGSKYVGVMYRPRAVGETQTFWRAVGVVDGTQLTYSTAVGGPPTLNQGQVLQFQTGTPFVVSSQDADHPFMLFEYMTGSGAVAGTSGLGDPDFVVVVPPDQYLDRYLFFTDPTFPETDLVVVRKRDGAGQFHDVTLDCAGTLTGWQTVGTDFQFTRVDLTTGNFQSVGNCSTGSRVMSSELPFGLWIWGWGSGATTPITRNVSYAYPGGMKVQAINALDF
jgi:hypothetical protein